MAATFLTLLQHGDEPRSLGVLLEFMGGATLWTWLAFLLALPLMWKLVYGPITKALEDRDKKVDDAIAAAETARKAAEDQVAAAKVELDKARTEARGMVEQALARAERQGQEALKVAEEKAKAQLTRASEQIAAEKHAALQEIRAHVVELSIAAAGALLKKKVDDASSKQLVADFVASAGKGQERR
jgi:F-type H+-transporting ATPase subunit b